MAAHNRSKGLKAEQIAEQYLLSLGFVVLHKNFHYGRYGEIDIIARDGETLVFVEVKARATDRYGSALESITPKKISHLRLAAEGYRQIFQEYEAECRFDVITLEYSSGVLQVQHFSNVL